MFYLDSINIIKHDFTMIPIGRSKPKISPILMYSLMNNWKLKLVILQNVAKLKYCGLFVFSWLPFLIKAREFVSLLKLSEMIDSRLKWRNFRSIDDFVEIDDFSFSIWLKLHKIRQETCIMSWDRIGISSFSFKSYIWWTCITSTATPPIYMRTVSTEWKKKTANNTELSDGR